MSTLYDEDLAEWAFRNADLLRSGKISEADLENIAEEIESLGISESHQLESRLTQILEHMLKLRLIEGALLESNRRGWKASVERQRIAIATLLKRSPSLKRQLNGETLADCYRGAAKAFEAGFEVTPPTQCPFTFEQILGSDIR